MYMRFVLFITGLALGCVVFLMDLGTPDMGNAGQVLSRDIQMRRAFLVHLIEHADGPGDFFRDPQSQIAGEWTIVTFSMLAAGLTNITMQDPATGPESSRLIAKLIDFSLKDDVVHFDRSAWAEDPLEPKTLEGDEGHIGYYGHLNLMLGCYALLNADGRYAALHRSVSDAIARRMRKYPHRQVATYPFEVYPPDNTVSAASLKIAGMVLPVNYDTLVKEWIEEEKKIEDPLTGLVVFSVHPASGRPTQPSRGSHSGWNSFFLPLVDEEYARAQYARFKRAMLRRFMGLAGFKEHADGGLFWLDVDAGPVLFGVGISATGFGVAGAQREGDGKLAAALLRFIDIFGVSGTRGEERRYLASPMVGDAIMLAMRTACPWHPLPQKD